MAASLFADGCKRLGPHRLAGGLAAMAPAVLLAFAALAPASALAGVAVIDDAGARVSLERPARRIISLAPHATEMLYAIGAGSSMVGVTDFSDYPPPARALPSVGSATQFDLERLASLRPDLIVAWGSGNNAVRVQQLRDMGYPVFTSEPRELETIASDMERLGVLAGTVQAARGAANTFRQQVRDLQARYRERAPVRVFYQVWNAPLMTLNGQHLVSQAITLCGGVNVFAALPQLAPIVGLEDVLQLDPEVILDASGAGNGNGFAAWRRFPRLTAVRRGNLYTVPSDTLTRGSPRIVEGITATCKALDLARSRRQQPVRP